MSRSFLRIFFAAVAATFVWFAFTREARAAAPQCDERGATTFAKNPVLEVSKASIDIGEDCNLPVPQVDDRAYEEGRGSLPDLGGTVAQSILPSHLGTVFPPSASLALAPPVRAVGPTGIRNTLERPPRA